MKDARLAKYNQLEILNILKDNGYYSSELSETNNENLS